jgi:hypothetical protein
MANRLLLEDVHFAHGLAPIADAFAGSVNSDVVNMKNYGQVTFLYYQGVGTTGTSTLTVEACDDAVPTTQNAVPFTYRSITATDVHGDITAAAAAGFTTTAGSNHIYIISVNVEALLADGYSYVRLAAVEVANAAVLGGILIILGEPRSTDIVAATALT